MFAAKAHSFQQQAKLAITLAWVAGYTNLLTILACGTAASHVTGTASNLGRDLAEGAWGLAGFAGYILTSFLCGAMISGYATELGHRRGWQSIYVLPMVIETLLLAVFAVGVVLHDGFWPVRGSGLFWMMGVASAAMGLQNATITRISSGVIRTTHVTGVLTDLGLEAVRFIWWLLDQRRDIPPGSVRGVVHSAQVHPTSRRLALLASVIVSFMVGAGLATFAFDHAPRWSMLPAVVFLIWLVYQDLRRPIAEIEISDVIAENLSDAMAVFHLHLRGHTLRMPDLQTWADKLPPTIQVVILDLSEALHLDANASLELGSIINYFAAQQRRLIIAGLNEDQISQLREAGLSRLLNPENVCPDLELAIARGMSLLEDTFPSSSRR